MRVKGSIREAMGEVMNWKKKRWSKEAMRGGATRIGRRTRRESKECRAMGPKRVVVLWDRAAETMEMLEVLGRVWRWKYHWETVAAEVALPVVSMPWREIKEEMAYRWIPEKIPRVHRYIMM